MDPHLQVSYTVAESHNVGLAQAVRDIRPGGSSQGKVQSGREGRWGAKARWRNHGRN